MRLKQFLFGILGLLALSSCSVNADDIRLDSVNAVKVDGITLSQARLSLEGTVSNDAGARLVLKEMNLEISDPRGKVATVRVDEKIILKANRSTDVILPLIIRFNDPLGAAGAIARMKSNAELLWVSGTIRGSNGLAGKKIEFEDIPMEAFLELLGLSDPGVFDSATIMK